MKILIAYLLSQLLITYASASTILGPIWFIGDSITQSNADGDGNGSPRRSLYNSLTSSNYDFSFTGHSTSNIDGLPTTGNTAATNFYHYHSGISGSLIGTNTNGRTNMTAGIPTWWNSGRLNVEKPNIALIMLGTNDIDINDDVANASSRMEILINTILAQPGADSTTLFLAQIPPNFGSTVKNDRVINFNNSLSTLVTNLQGNGVDINLVDMYSPLIDNRTTLMRDNLHTNAAGNDVLAQQWFNAIETRFVPEPSSLLLLSFTGLLAFVRRR